MSTFVDAAFATRIPDPAERALAVQQFLAQSGTAADARDARSTSLRRTSCCRRPGTASAVLIGVRNSLAFNVFYTKSDAISGTGSALPPALQFGQNNTQTGGGVSFSHRLSGMTNLTASATYSTDDVQRHAGAFADAGPTTATLSARPRHAARAEDQRVARRQLHPVRARPAMLEHRVDHRRTTSSPASTTPSRRSPCTKPSTDFTGKPFQLNPDPAFYFGSRQHRRAMAYLEYGLHQNEGFIVVTGDVGAGKTTIVRSLLDKLDPEQVVAGNLVSTQLDAEDTLRLVGVVVRPAHEGRREVGSAALARGVPRLGEPAGQARAAHRRRGAEPDAARGRGAAHAVELPARDARAAAELPRRPAGVPAHDAEPGRCCSSASA